MTFETAAQALLAGLDGTARIRGTACRSTTSPRLRGELIDALAFDAVFNADEGLRDAAAG